MPRWSIGLALLEDNPFNRSKTNNKYREYASFGIPTIYSDMPVYSTCVKHRVTGFLTPHTEKGVSEALDTLTSDRNLREKIRREALQDVSCNYSLKAAQLQMLREISRLAIERMAHSIHRPKILVIGYDKVSSTHIDALQPCRELEKRGLLEFAWCEPEHAVEADFPNYDAIHLVRAFEALILPVLEWAKREQKPFICSWDDNFFLLPTNTPLGQVYSQPEIRKVMEKFLRECSLIMTSTPPLAAYSRKLNPQVLEAIYGIQPPNCPPQNGFDAGSSTDKVRIGFFGVNQAINAPFLIETFKELRNRFPEGSFSRPSA